MADMRSIGTAVESFAIDEDLYPEQSRDLLPVSLIVHSLQPLYIKELPLLDPWGEPFLYWCNGTEYIIVSTGEDGRFDRNYRLGPGLGKAGDFSGAFSVKGTDIIFSNGQFVQWPEGVMN